MMKERKMMKKKKIYSNAEEDKNNNKDNSGKFNSPTQKSHGSFANKKCLL